MFVKRIRWQLKQPFHFWLVHSMPSKQVSNSVRQSVWQKLLRVIVSSFNRDSVSPNGFSVACRWSQMVFIKPQYIHNFSFLKVWNILLVPVKEAIKSLIQRLRRLLNILMADFNNSFIPLFAVSKIISTQQRAKPAIEWMRKLRRIAVLWRISPGIYHFVQLSSLYRWGPR